MVLLNNTFVPENEEDAGFELIPTGSKCIVVVKESDVKPTSAGTGEYIKITMEVLDDGGDGKFNGKKLWHNFNIVNPSEMAVRIGKGQLKRLCTILGIDELTDTAQLHGEPFGIVVGIQKGKDGYEDSNVVKKFLPVNELHGGSDGESDSGLF